jgi:two-component system sensor histidine kinase PhoQ
MMSLHGRVAWSAAIVLTVFVLVTAFALDRAFGESVREAREQRLLGQIYLLLGAADLDEDGKLVVPDNLPEARFSQPGSGLYGEVTDEEGKAVWRSSSAVGAAPAFHERLGVGERRFEQRRDAASNVSFLVESQGVSWATGETPRTFTFSIAEDMGAFSQEINRYRASLAGWLGGMVVLLLAVLALTLHWGLRPLRQVRREIERVQAGDQERVVGAYPPELRGLTGSVNALLTHERAQQKRLRNALDDLAHSLKTPLAVMRGAIAEGRVEGQLAAVLDEQVGQMDRIVQHQLQRALTRSALGIGAPVAVRPLAEKLKASLLKLPREKAVAIDLDIASSLSFRGAEGDLLEVLGNLLDNACKWSRSRVRLAGTRSPMGVELTVEDDGAGVDPALADRLLERGARADESVPGHGIGLAIVRDIATAYSGAVRIERSSLGGACVVIRLRD